MSPRSISQNCFAIRPKNQIVECVNKICNIKKIVMSSRGISQNCFAIRTKNQIVECANKICNNKKLECFQEVF